MTATESLAIIKALADESRMAIVSSLLERPQYVEELAKRHALAPSTVSFHLKKLEQAGLITSRKEQYYVVVAANEPLLATTLRELIAVSTTGKAAQDERLEEYRRKVIDTFFPRGVLEKLPAQHKKRLIVLEQFAARFEPGRRYAETEVTGLLRPLFDAYCTVRRLLVVEGQVQRVVSWCWRESPAGE
ncbi:MAG: metalloregulator ArsR/SmtB family transcription factor, partial [Geobacter sp.]|nr:metalloregulator ArsR/SmtB family transcription factor [Geobacter sp.]